MSNATLTQLGRYRILSELGRGAMGVVYKAEDPLLNRSVAIKTIIMSADADERAEYEARFYQEAKAAGGLNHPNVVTIHDIGREDTIAYMAMELIDGVELREMMKVNRVALPLALDLMAQVADGLAFAHERGVVHRDVKPANIMIVRDRHVKIMDFGIARMRESDVHTRTGAILGSPKYMSPEQVSGERTDHRSDIFSLGVMLYELVAGEPPFTGSQIAKLMHNIATAIPRTPSSVNPALPAMLDLIVGKALEKPLDTRYQNAAELAADLRACAAGLPAETSAVPAVFDATLRLDATAEETQRADAMAQTVPNGEAMTTLMQNTATASTGPPDAVKTTLAAPITRPHTRATDSGVHLLLSRRIDSAAALQHLTALSAANSGAQTNGLDTSNSGIRQASLLARVRKGIDQLQRDPERKALALTVIAAIAAAIAITFVGVGAQ